MTLAKLAGGHHSSCRTAGFHGAVFASAGGMRNTALGMRAMASATAMGSYISYIIYYILYIIYANE